MWSAPATRMIACTCRCRCARNCAWAPETLQGRGASSPGRKRARVIARSQLRALEELAVRRVRKHTRVNPRRRVLAHALSSCAPRLPRLPAFWPLVQLQAPASGIPVSSRKCTQEAHHASQTARVVRLRRAWATTLERDTRLTVRLRPRLQVNRDLVKQRRNARLFQKDASASSSVRPGVAPSFLALACGAARRGAARRGAGAAVGLLAAGCWLLRQPRCAGC